MSTDFKLTLHPDYIPVELAPGYEIRPEGTTELTLALSDVCSRQSQRRVLVEGTVARRHMGTMDAFGFASDEQTQLFKDVTQDRGVRIEFFGSREAALRWLGVG